MDVASERLVMWRDASFLRNPGCATKYHLPREGAAIALCSRRILLDEKNTCTERDAGPLMCKRCANLSPCPSLSEA